jgi:hypothetical protein
MTTYNSLEEYLRELAEYLFPDHRVNFKLSWELEDFISKSVTTDKDVFVTVYGYDVAEHHEDGTPSIRNYNVALILKPSSDLLNKVFDAQLKLDEGIESTKIQDYNPISVSETGGQYVDLNGIQAFKLNLLLQI